MMLLLRTHTVCSLARHRGVTILTISVCLSGSSVGEHELLLVVLEEGRGSLHINEKIVHFTDVLLVDFGGLALLSDQVRCCDQVNGVTERALLANLC